MSIFDTSSLITRVIIIFYFLSFFVRRGEAAPESAVGVEDEAERGADFPVLSLNNFSNKEVSSKESE